MADDGYSVDTEQRRTAILGIIQPLSEIVKGVVRQNCADFCLDRFAQLLTQHGAKGFDQSFAQFEHDIAGEAIVDDHVHVTPEYITSFDVADEIDWSALQ